MFSACLGGDGSGALPRFVLEVVCSDRLVWAGLVEQSSLSVRVWGSRPSRGKVVCVSSGEYCAPVCSR